MSTTAPDDRSPTMRAVGARAEVLRLARLVAADAPARQGQYVHRAGIKWVLIHQLRQALTDMDNATAEVAAASGPTP